MNPHPWLSYWGRRHNVYVSSNSQWCGEIVLFPHLSTYTYVIGLMVLPTTSCNHKCGWILHFFKSAQTNIVSFVCQIWFSTHFHKYFSSWCITSNVFWMSKPCTIILQFKNINNPNYKITSSSSIMHGCVIDFFLIIIKTKKS